MTQRTSTICFGLLLVIFVLHALYLGGIAEDAFISLRYARHLAEGMGLVWNAGEPPVEGYTNFLWVLLCAGATAIGLDPLRFALAAGICASLVAMVYGYRFAREILQAGPGGSLLPPLMLAVSGPFAAWASAGMETGLFTMLILAGAFHTVRHRQSNRIGDLYTASILLFFATLTRPEGLLVFAVLFAWEAFFPGASGPGRSRIRPVAIYAILIIIYTLWRFNYFGDLLPMTFYAKTGGGWRQYARGALYALFFGLYFVVPLAPGLIGPFHLVFSRLRTGTLPVPRFAIALCLAVTGWYTLYIIVVGGDYMAMYRFFVPLLPFLYLVFAAGILVLANAPAFRHWRFRLPAALVTFAVLATVIQSTPLEADLFVKPPRQHGTWRGIQTERWHVARLTLIARFFDSYAPPGTDIATPAIGVISCFTSMNVYGFFGLTDPHIARQSVRTPGATIGWPGHEKEDFAYLFSKLPTFIMFSRALTQDPLPFPDHASFSLSAQLGGAEAEPGDEASRLDEFLRKHYDLTAVRLIDRENGESGYFTFLELKEEYRGRRLPTYHHQVVTGRDQCRCRSRCITARSSRRRSASGSSFS